MILYVQTPSVRNFQNGISDDNAAHGIVIQYCFKRGLTPIDTKIDMETIELHKNVSQTFIYTYHKRF